MVKAHDFMKSDEKILVIFTRGMDFKLNDDNTGVTGEWGVNLDRFSSVDRVLIYHRNGQPGKNDLYIANNAGIEPSTKEGKHNIQLNHVQYIGATSLNWKEFADTGETSFRYLP